MGADARAQNVLSDDADRLPLLSNKKSDNSVVSSFAYMVDKTGNRTKLTLSNGDYAEYVYDQTYQLTREHRKDSQNATLYYNNFRYDAAGNRTRLEYNDGTSTTTTSYLYNTADQLTRETTGATVTTYLYDVNGSLTKKDDGTNVHAYKYDVRNLMTDYDGPGANNDATYKYGASSLRVQKTVGGSTITKYYHDGLNTVAEYNGNDQLQRTYVTPGLDQNLSLTASGNTYYYLTDALGSIRQLLDADQSTQNCYDYQAFGSVYGSPTENVTQPFRFTGREWDAENGLYYYRARHLNPEAGCLLSREPNLDGSGRSLYCYVSCSPVSWVDPTGLTTIFVDKLLRYDFSDIGKRWPEYGFVETQATATDIRDHLGHTKADDVWVYFGHTGRKDAVPGYIMAHRPLRANDAVPASDLAAWISEASKSGTGTPPALAVVASCCSCQEIAPKLLAAGVRCVACFDCELPAGGIASMVKNAFNALKEGENLQSAFGNAPRGVLDDAYVCQLKVICTDPADLCKTLPQLLAPRTHN
jgi:RHS repeat-associated protein